MLRFIFMLSCLLATAWAQSESPVRGQHQTPSGLWVRYATDNTRFDTLASGVRIRPLTGVRSYADPDEQRLHYLFQVPREADGNALFLPQPFDRSRTITLDPRDPAAVQAYNQDMEWEEQYQMARARHMSFLTLQLATGLDGRGPQSWYVQPRLVLQLPTGLIHPQLTGLFSVGVGPRWRAAPHLPTVTAGSMPDVSTAPWEGYAQVALPLRSWLIGYRYQVSAPLEASPLQTGHYLVLGLGRAARSQPFYLRATLPADRLWANPSAVANPRFYRLELGCNLLNLGNGAKRYAKRIERQHRP